VASDGALHHSARCARGFWQCCCHDLLPSPRPSLITWQVRWLLLALLLHDATTGVLTIDDLSRLGRALPAGRVQRLLSWCAVGWAAAEALSYHLVLWALLLHALVEVS
jgi:hypothetical protein